MNSHYRTFFQILSKNEDDDVGNQTIYLILKWLKSKYNDILFSQKRFFTYGEFKTKDLRIFIKVTSTTPNKDTYIPKYWALRLEEKDSTNPQVRKWITDIGIEQISRKLLNFSLITSYKDRDGYFGELPDAPTQNTPRIISMLINNEMLLCSSGSVKLKTDPILLNNGDALKFKQILSDKDRNCPIVYISRQYQSDLMLLDPFQLAKRTAGNGLVFYNENYEFDKEHKYFIEKEFRCWGGMIRIYEPRLDLKDQSNSIRHRFFTIKDIEEKSKTEIENLIIRGLSKQPKIWARPTISRIEDVDNEYRRYKLIQYKNEQGSVELANWLDEFDEEVQKLKEENQKKEEECYYSKLEKEDLERQLKSLRYQCDSVVEELSRYKYQCYAYEQTAAALDNISQLPSTPFEAINIIEKLYPNRIRFTERAKKSAIDAEDWLKADLIWRCIFDIVTYLYPLYFDESNDGINICEVFNCKSVFELALTEGKQTNKDTKLLRCRKDVYENKDIELIKHVKLGSKNKSKNFIRVYFDIDKDNKVIIIGHCGEHLDNYSSQFIK